MSHVTEADLDELEFETLRTGDHAAAARRLGELADTVSEGVSRASILLRSGEQWQHAGEHEMAATYYRRAIDDGGGTYGDPRAYLADALFETGEPEPARELVAAIRAESPSDPEVYRSVAELLYAHGDISGAQDWATEGVRAALAHSDENLEGLLRIRYRARMDLAMPEDSYDAMLDELLKAD